MNKMFYVFAVVFACAFSGAAFSAEDATTKEARAFVDDLSSKAFSYIKDKNLSDSGKEDKLEDLFRNAVDANWMGKFVMGKYFRTTEDSQKKRYLKLYEDYLVMSYIPKFRKYTGQELEILKITPDSGDYIVQTNLKSVKQGEPDVRVDYRIKKTGGAFRVIDIVGEGVSLISTQRSDFGGLISRKGVEHFINKLEERVNKLASGDSVKSSS